jgi:hypothetical protein
MKIIGKILAVISLVISILWEISNPDYEPLLCIAGSLASIIALWATDDGIVTMRQNNKDKSTGYQANKIIIKNKDK